MPWSQTLWDPSAPGRQDLFALVGKSLGAQTNAHHVVRHHRPGPSRSGTSFRRRSEYHKQLSLRDVYLPFRLRGCLCCRSFLRQRGRPVLRVVHTAAVCSAYQPLDAAGAWKCGAKQRPRPALSVSNAIARSHCFLYLMVLVCDSRRKLSQWRGQVVTLKMIALAALSVLAATDASAQSVGTQSWVPSLAGVYRCVQNCAGAGLAHVTQNK
jgi:hypothetical protein